MGRYSPAIPPETQSLHPVLQASLANLDVQLEAELSRYRRLRSVKGRPASGGRPQPKPLDLISVAATPVTETSSTSLPAGDREAPPHAIASPPPAGPASAAVHPSQPATEPSIAPPPGSATAHSTQLVAEAETQPHELSATATIAEELLESDTEIEDYLESSEELLRSLAAEEAKVQAERGFMRSLLTPLGLGSLLLLLLSSAMFGYVVMNPTSFSHWLTARNSAGSSSQPAASSPAPTAALDAPQPNLAAREFKDLNLATLGTLKTAKAAKATQPTATPGTTKPAGAASLGASGSAAAVTSPPPPLADSTAATPAIRTSEPEPVSQPEPTYQEAAPAAEPSGQSAPVYEPPTAAPPAPEPQPAAIDPEPAPPAATTAYPVRVVTPYTGDSSLDAVQKVVPDAFVNGSGDVQAGAFPSAADAEARAAELRQQGIPAEVQQR